MNTILPKFVDFNSKTAFRPITQNHFYQNVHQHAFDIIVATILAALVVSLIHAWCHPASYRGRDLLIDVVAGYYLVIICMTPFIMTSDLWLNFSSILAIVLCLFIFLLCLIDWWISLPAERGLRLINVCKSVLVTLGAITITFAGCAYIVNDKLNSESNSLNMAKYNTSGFKITNTNLMAAPYKISIKQEKAHNLDPTKNYHRNNYYVYVDLANPKPKGIDTKQITYKTPINMQTMSPSQDENSSNRKTDVYYLGQMKNGHFMPNYQNIKVGHTFMGYQKYIKVHQLESKFKHHFSFELSYKYLANNENPTLIVVGDNDFNLHYKNAKEFSYSKIVQSEKE